MVDLPPVARSHVQLDTPALARQHLLRGRASAVTISSGRDPFGYEVRSVDDGHIGVHDIRHTGTIQAFFTTRSWFWVVLVMSGSMQVSTQDDIVSVAAGSAVLVGTNTELWIRSRRGYLRSIRVKAEDMRPAAANGRPDVRLDDIGAVLLPSSNGVRNVDTVARFARDNVLSTGLAEHADARSAAHLLLATAIADAYARAPVDVAEPQQDGAAGPPSAVRRAVLYIEANAQQPLRLSDVCTHVGIPARTLQGLFRRQLGTTPSRLLQQVRLAGAHADLSAADGDTVTVAEIADRWQFAHAGHFAAIYRQRYGTNPAVTLREAR